MAFLFRESNSPLLDIFVHLYRTNQSPPLHPPPSLYSTITENKAVDSTIKDETTKSQDNDKSVPDGEKKEMINDAWLLASIAAMASTEVKTVSTPAETPSSSADEDVVIPVTEKADDGQKSNSVVANTGTNTGTSVSTSAVTDSSCPTTNSPSPNLLDPGCTPITPNTSSNTVDTLSQTPSTSSKTSSITIEESDEPTAAIPAMMRHVVTVPKRTPPLPPPLYLKDDDNTTNPKDDDEGCLLLKTPATKTPNLSPSCSVKSVRPPVPAPPKCLELNHDGDDDGVKQPPQPPHQPHPPHNPNKRILSLPPGETGEP